MSKVYVCPCGSLGSTRLGCFAVKRTGEHLPRPEKPIPGAGRKLDIPDLRS